MKALVFGIWTVAAALAVLLVGGIFEYSDGRTPDYATLLLVTACLLACVALALRLMGHAKAKRRIDL